MSQGVRILLWLCALIALLGLERAAAAGDPPVALATQFVDLLAQGDFAGASERCDAIMRQALPEPKLKKTWETLQEQAGHFKKRLQTRRQKIGGFDVVLVTCQFESLKLDIKVALNAKGEVSGLFFLPSTASSDDSAPAYASTNAFHEQAFTVGTGAWRLPGTLTLPTKVALPCPAVALVQGSGPSDRDETVGAVKPFRDLAWGLATKGIAVLRYEKRTKQYASRFVGAESLKITVREESIDDALSAVEQLRATDGIDAKRVFVLGCSLGGTLAPRIGLADPRIAGLIIMAGATRPLEDLIVAQTRYLLSLKGTPTTAEQQQLSELEAAAARIKQLKPGENPPPRELLGIPPGYWLDLHAHDPVAEAAKTSQPILILQGGRDYQVTRTDFNQWKAGLASSPRVTFELYPQLNHLFISGEGKSTPQDYDKPAHVAGVVISDIADWILTRH